MAGNMDNHVDQATGTCTCSTGYIPLPADANADVIQGMPRITTWNGIVGCAK